MYFPGPGEYDLSGDGKPDVILYKAGTDKPKAEVGVQVYQLGKELTLTNDTTGYIDYHRTVTRTPFDENRDYLYPIPINERSLNPNLTQNPGWNDGLSI